MSVRGKRETPVGELTKPVSPHGSHTFVPHTCSPERGDKRGTGRMAMDLDVWYTTFLSYGTYAGTDGETEAQDKPKAHRISGGWTGVKKEKRER